MIYTPTYNGTIERKPQSRVNSGINIHVPRYCKELEDVIAVANRKGYRLPTDYQLKCTNNFIIELKIAGIFQLKDIFYICGFNSLYNDGLGIANPSRASIRNTIEQFTQLNYKNPNLFECSRVTGTETSLRFPYHGVGGWSNGNNTTSYLNTGWSQVNAVNWAQNSASFSCYIADNTNNIQTSGVPAGSTDTAASRSTLRFTPWNASNVATIRINSTAGLAANIGSTSTNIGFWSGDRSASNLITVYYNGSSIGTVGTASATMISTQPVFLTALNQDGSPNNTFQPGFLSYFSLGASLGATLQKKEYEIFTAFRTKLGYQ